MLRQGFRKAYVVGVGMTKFEKPGRRPNFDYPDMAKESVGMALKDAKLSYDAIEQAYAGYVYGDSTCGQRALYQVGLTGIPIINVNNNCATGSTALYLAKQAVISGVADCVLAVGFEKMQRGSIGSNFMDRTGPLDKHLEVIDTTVGLTSAPRAPQLFGVAAQEHMKRYGTKLEQFAKVAEKNHRHSVNNPKSQFQDEYSIDQILASPMVFEPLTKLQCCPTSDGSAAAVVVSEDFLVKNGLEEQAIEIIGMEMSTDYSSTFETKSAIKLIGYDMSAKAAEKVFAKSKLTPDDIDVIELHDCFSANELITYEALGLCQPGKAGELIDRGDNTYGGKFVVNPSGGLISKGHPLGATGLAQCYELSMQLRGTAGVRQVKDARYALQHNLGLGGAAVVAIYAKAFSHESPRRV